MSDDLSSRRASIHQLLTQLQALYRQLADQSPSDRADYYHQRMAIIEQARSRLWVNDEHLEAILDEFGPEYEIMREAVDRQ